MAQQIKNFWLKIGTMFMTLYFMPLSHFIMSIFGHNASDANAGTVYCAMNGGSADTNSPKRNCDGVENQTLHIGESVLCKCPTDLTKVQEIICGLFEVTGMGDETGSEQPVMGPAIFVNPCEKLTPCSNGEIKDCSSDTQYGTRTCTNGTWGNCVMGNCKNGYIKIGTICKASCQIENGTGYEYETSSSSSTTA